MKECTLVKEDYELIYELLKQHTRCVEHATDEGDFIIEPTLAEFRDHSIRARLAIEQILIKFGDEDGTEGVED